MTPLGLTLVLVAALCHATWNFFVKRINGGPELVWLFSALSTVLYLPLAIAIVVLQEVTFDLEQSLFIAGSVALHLAYVMLLQAGYRNGDLSLVYPMARATGPLLSTTFAVFFLGETVTAQMGLGAGVIICGVLLAPIALRRRAAVIGHWREHRTGVLAIAVLSPLAYILVLHALTFTPVAYVAPLREVSVLLTVLAASLLLGEGRLRRRLIWSAVIVGGVVLLA
ncbi:MAG: EamA family transporter [Pseudomonadota bacterium]|nr:EamA family transporter [Pseudomonadota bacterium]